MLCSGCEATPTDSASSIQNQLCCPSRRSASDASTSAHRPVTVTSRRYVSTNSWRLARHDGSGGGACRAAAAGSVSDVALAVSGVTLLVVLLVDVDTPDVVIGAEDVLHRQHRGVHRMVLVVVAVHAVAADGIDVGRVLLEPGAHRLDTGLVRVVVEGVRLRHPDDVPGLDYGGIDEPEL